MLHIVRLNNKTYIYFQRKIGYKLEYAVVLKNALAKNVGITCAFSQTVF